MAATGIAAWILGPPAILAGAYLMHSGAGVNEWVSLTLLGAALLVLVGFSMVARLATPGD